MRSWAVAPSPLSALTTSDSCALPSSIISAAPSCLISISAFSVTTVAPCEKGAGWLTWGVVEIETDRLPWATALCPSVTDWFITTEPVRAFTMTRARGRTAATAVGAGAGGYIGNSMGCR